MTQSNKAGQLSDLEFRFLLAYKVADIHVTVTDPDDPGREITVPLTEVSFVIGEMGDVPRVTRNDESGDAGGSQAG